MYVCFRFTFCFYSSFQDIEPDAIASQSNHILTAIVHGMKRDEPNDHVRLAATTALLNSLEFTKQNFERDAERHFIMQVGILLYSGKNFFCST